jgi:hypothetical protein
MPSGRERRRLRSTGRLQAEDAYCGERLLSGLLHGSLLVGLGLEMTGGRDMRREVACAPRPFDHTLPGCIGRVISVTFDNEIIDRAVLLFDRDWLC